MAINNLMIVAVAAIIMAAVLAFGNGDVRETVEGLVNAVTGGGAAAAGGAAQTPSPTGG